MSTVTEWLAVCGGGGGGVDPKIVAEVQAVLAANKQASLERLLNEQQELLTLVRSIQQSGKAGIELGKVLAELYTLAVTDQRGFPPERYSTWVGPRWIGEISPNSGTISYGTRRYSVIAKMTDGTLHIVEKAEPLSAIAFARGIATLCSSPSVASVEVRRTDANPYQERWHSSMGDLWGGTVFIGTRYATLDEMARTISGQIVVQPPSVLPETLTAPNMELVRPSAQPPLESSVQGVSASKILPWVLGAAGVAVVVMLVARQRRKK